jgi:hypothetical protein
MGRCDSWDQERQDEESEDYIFHNMYSQMRGYISGIFIDFRILLRED